MIKTEYALNKVTGKLVHVESEEIIKNTNYQVECLCCGEPLIAKAKESEKITAHFAHYSNTQCILKNMSNRQATKTHGESILHRRAKELFEDEKEIYIPHATISSIEADDLNNKKFCKKEEQYLGKIFPIVSVDLEKTEGKIRPDIKLGVKGFNKSNLEQIYTVYVEIAVTHFIDEEKKEKIIKNHQNVIQIDLENFPEKDIDDLIKIIKEIKNPQRYELINFYFPKQESIREKLNKEYILDLELHNQKIINTREKLIKNGLINDFLIDIKDNQYVKDARCLCCGTILTSNKNHFYHPLKENCLIFKQQEELQVFNKYNEIKVVKTFQKYLEYLKQNNKLWKLPETKIIVNKSYEYHDEKFKIGIIKYFEGNDFFKIIEIETFTINNKSLLLVKLENPKQNKYSLIINFLNNKNDNEITYIDDYSLNIRCFNIKDIHLKDYFSLINDLSSWNNFNLTISEEKKNKLISEHLKKEIIVSHNKKEKIRQEQELKDLQKSLELQRIAEEKKNKELKIQKLYNNFDNAIDKLYREGTPITIKENYFMNMYDKVVFFKNNLIGYISKYEKKLKDGVKYYEIVLNSNEEKIILAVFISLDYFHELNNDIENIQYRCPIRYFDIEKESVSISENSVINNVKEIKCCLPTSKQKIHLEKEFFDLKLENERKLEEERRIQLKNKELKEREEKQQLRIKEQVEKREKEQKRKLEEEERKELLRVAAKQKIDNNLNALLDKKIKFTKEDKDILIEKITDVEINSKNELVSFKINKNCIIFVLNNKDSSKSYLLFDEIMNRVGNYKNKDIGCLFFNNIASTEIDLLLISHEELKLQKIDLYKKYDKIKFYFAIIEKYKIALERKYISLSELFEIVDFYNKNKQIFADRFSKNDMSSVDKLVNQILKEKI